MRIGLSLALTQLGVVTHGPPTISGVSPGSGVEAGGTSITITGTNFDTGATVTVGGVAATAVVVTSASITCATPAGTGLGDVVVTNPDARTVTSVGAFRYYINPASLALTGYWKPNYSGTPWVGTASAGNSASHNISQVSTPATNGTAVDGATPASFEGTDDYLQDATIAGANYLSASAYTVVILVKPVGGAAPNANAYADQKLYSHSGDIQGISWTTSGVRAFHFNGVNFTPTSHVACSAGAWHMVAVTYDGTTLSISVDNGTPATIARGNVGSLGASALLTLSKGDANFAQEDVLEVAVSQANLSASLAGIYQYFKATYPSTGLP